MNKKMMICKSCGREIAKSAKACPGCGAKNKKPLFKKWWFWVIVVFALIGSSGGEDASVETAERIESSSNTESIVATFVNETETIEVPTTEEPVEDLTMGQRNALKAAENYLRFTAFSYEGLISQLEFEQYSREDAVYAVDHCGADWNEQALKAAKNYLDFTAFSYEGLIDQLVFEGFTNEQAIYGVEQNGY